MSAHSESCKESSILCDQLFHVLNQKIKNLQKSQSVRWCGFFEKGKKRFAYINHRKTQAKIEIWCLGNPDELMEKSTFSIIKRVPTSGGFGRDFQARFFIESSYEIEAVAQLLYSVSYPES
jgi:hypothetical protein